MKLPENPLRIAYLVSQYPTVSHTFILREIRALREMGLQIRVISIRDPDRPGENLSPVEREESRGTYCVTASVSRALRDHLLALFTQPAGYLRGILYALRLSGLDLGALLYNIFYFAEAVVVGQEMKRERLNHVHIHFSSTVGLFVAKIFPISISITIHGSDEFSDMASFHMTEKIAASSFICAISSYGRSQLMKASGYEQWMKFEVAPLGVDTSVFLPRPFRDKPPLYQLLYVGRLAPPKGQHILIAAVDLLVKRGYPVRLRLVGDGPDRRSLEQDVATRGLGREVVFEGAVNQNQVHALYREADIFALSSFAEGVPVVLMEAMAMEIPCVATRITGIPELIRDGTDGLLVTPSDDEELAAAIARLIDDPALRQTIGRAGRRRVLDKYDLGRNITRLAEILTRRLG
jgi:glycosyltransferase involved in cell wall biosynthesis